MITETDVANRGLQRIGVAVSIAPGALWTEDSDKANQMRLCYDMIRRGELRRNVWRYSIRTETLRVFTPTTKLLFYPDWDPAVYYTLNDRVQSNGRTWIAVGSGIGNDPQTRDYIFWTTYFGCDTCDVFDPTVTYNTAEQVYDSGLAYVSVIDDNLGEDIANTLSWLPIAPPPWNEFYLYSLGARVVFNGITYVSKVASNELSQPDTSPTKWAVTGSLTLRQAAFTAPIANGQNVFRLPMGWLRNAPQAPKQGSYMPLGAPSGNPYSDFDYEGNYFRTSLSGPIQFRFCADIEDPNLMDPLFIDGFTARLGLETCEVLTQSDKKLADIGGHYKMFMSEARTVNAIEEGPVEPPEDVYISLRN